MEELHKPESTARQYLNGVISEEESFFRYDGWNEKVELYVDKMFEFMDTLEEVFKYCERNYQSYEIQELKEKNDKLQRELMDEKDCYRTQMDLWNADKRKLKSKIEKLEHHRA